jgi:hypothetical protein
MPYFNQDLTQIFNDELTFDLHLDAKGNHLNPEEWEMKDGRKNIKYIDNKPYCYNTRLQKNIRFILLHFQGRNKEIMNNWFEKKN